MVTALSGTLLKCDPPTMEIVRQINETKHFIIEQIDEGVALCKPIVFEFLKEEVTRRLEIAECFMPTNDTKGTTTDGNNTNGKSNEDKDE